MSRPFKAHLQVTTTSPSRLWYSVFKDYYSTAGENLKVINAPAHGLVKIVDIRLPSKLLAKGNVDANGVANLDIGQYHFPLNAQILVYNSTNSMVASTAKDNSLYGGDIYSVKTGK